MLGPRIVRLTQKLTVEGEFSPKVKVSPSTQNKAFSALLFRYKKVLKMDVGKIRMIIRPKRSVKIPVVFTQDEVREVNWIDS